MACLKENRHYGERGHAAENLKSSLARPPVNTTQVVARLTSREMRESIVFFISIPEKKPELCPWRAGFTGAGTA